MLAHRINPPWDEGIKNNVIRLSRALTELGTEVHILTTLDRKLSCEGKIGSIEFHRIPLFNPESSHFDKAECFLFRSIPQIKKLVNDLGCTVLHVHLHPSLLTFLGSTILKLAKIPIVQTVHAQPRHVLNCRSRVQVKMGSAQADIVTISSMWLKNQLIKCGVSTKKMRRVLMGVFLEDYIRRCKKEKLEQFGFSKDDFIILYGSGIGPHRGDMLMLKVLERVCTKAHNVKCLFNTRRKDHEQINDRITLIRNKIRKMHLQDNVRLIGVREDMGEIYSISHTLVMSSMSAIAKLDYPLTIIEAFATAIPVIATNVGGIPELVIDNFNGFLIPPGNAKLLEQTIIKMVNNPQLRLTLGNNARRFAEEHFDMYKTAKRFMEIYGILSRK